MGDFFKDKEDFEEQLKREGTELLQQFMRYAIASFSLDVKTENAQKTRIDKIFLTYSSKYSRMDEHLASASPSQLIVIPTYYLGDLTFTAKKPNKRAVQIQNMYCQREAVTHIGRKLKDAVRIFEQKPISCKTHTDEGPVAVYGVHYFNSLYDREGPLAPKWLKTYRTNDDLSKEFLENLVA